ncbi:MAG TPA: hypothetical protein VFO07_04365 [Roseiflexaceae bacterium]|nr:hypothetical protein [Roseiflexaceae bacterium]
MARRRLGVGWRYFGYGVLILFLFQLISRVPLVQLAQTLMAPQLRESYALQMAWLAILAHTTLNFVAAGLPLMLGMQGIAALLVPEALVTVAGLARLWAIWAPRDSPEGVGKPEGDTAPEMQPLEQ